MWLRGEILRSPAPRLIHHKCCKPHHQRRQLYCTKASKPNLELVGHFSPKLSHRNIYKPGQVFLHRVFGYRGVIMHPWIASVYEQSKSGATAAVNSPTSGKLRGTSLQVHTYYQVLMDMRDFPSNQSENAFIFTSLNVGDPNNLLDVIPGMDYVDHRHVMPYKSSEKLPIQHPLFEHFFDLENSKTSSFAVSNLLTTWQEENSSYLEVDKVYVTVSDQIRVSIIPFYLGFKQERHHHQHQDEYWWRYTVCVENLNDKDDVVICERHWKIISNGSVKKSRNVGETGKTPVLGARHPVYFNTSHISLKTSSGTVRGLLKLKLLRSGKRIDIKTPTFFLESRFKNS